MELQQATLCWWNSSLVCNGYKLWARKGSLLPMGFLWNFYGISTKIYAWPCVNIPQNAKCLISLSSLQPSQFPYSAHQDWLMMPLDPVFMEMCCPSLDCLVPSEQAEKRSFLNSCNYPRIDRISPPFFSKDKPNSSYFALGRSFPA